MQAVFVTGTAGAGKSMLTAALAEWYGEKELHAITVNLDPGAVALPYEPDVDVKQYVNIYALMEEKELGPNGALVLASDMLAANLASLQDEIDSHNPDIAILDTPGQVELFAYRQSGPFIVENLKCEEKAILYLFDAPLVKSAANFVSIALLGASIQLRLRAPQIPVLSKADLEPELGKIGTWTTNPAILEEEVAKEVGGGTAYLLTRGILRNLVRLGLAYQIIPVSATKLKGFVELSALITRVLRRGEEKGE